MDDEKYIAIQPGAILPGVLPKFKVYFYSPEGYYLLWAVEGNKVTSKQLDKLTEGGLREVYIDPEENFEYEEYLETNLGKILENQTTTVDQKAAIFSKVSTNVVKTAFEDSFGQGVMGPEALKRTETLINNALLFITETKSLSALAQMIGHDYKTYEHATKVLWFTVAFLKEHPYLLEIIQPGYQTLPEPQQMEILRQCGVGALLHDIGKAYIPLEILNKNGPMNKVELEIMKRHPLNGLAMLLVTGIPEFVKKAVLQHHEDFDGSGYPMNLKGLHINILARVLRITDTFDAMTSRLPYKEPHPPKKAIEIMIGAPPKKKKRNETESEEEDDRDQGMIQCFDEDLLRKFILFLGKTTISQ